MASIRILKRRIKTSKNIAKITRAMEMVAASKMKRAQEAALASRLYSEELGKVLDRLAYRINREDHPLLSEGNPQGQTGILLLSTDKGLCGGLNTNLFIKLRTLKAEQERKHNLKVISVGKKAKDYVAKSGDELWASFVELGDFPTSIEIRPITKLVVDAFINQELSEFWVVYPAFVSTLVQEARAAKLLPMGSLDVIPEAEEESHGDYLFEPEAKIILDEILPYYIENRIYQLLLEAKASEQSARMVSMKNARENADELSDDLTLTYNRMRQARITNELLDAIGSRLVLE